MITTMVWVIIMIIILVLLMILVLKMTKKYHITWYWCQNIRDNMVEKRVKKFGQGPPPPFSGNARKKTFFLSEMLPLSRWHQINNNMIRFRIGKKIANGAFGQLRLVKDLLTGEVGGEVNHANQAKLQLIVFQKLFSEKSEINYWFIIYDKKEISEKYWNFSNAHRPKAPPTTPFVVIWYINVCVPKRK